MLMLCIFLFLGRFWQGWDQDSKCQEQTLTLKTRTVKILSWDETVSQDFLPLL